MYKNCSKTLKKSRALFTFSKNIYIVKNFVLSCVDAIERPPE